MKIIYNDGHTDECTKEDELHVLRHSAAHIMAQAVKRLYPQAKLAYGPANEKGFYYDLDLGDTRLTDSDLPAIEAEMKKIVKENLPFRAFILPRDEAIELMRERGEDYKVEHIADLPEDEAISFYQQGDYIDMCRGPHIRPLYGISYRGNKGAFPGMAGSRTGKDTSCIGKERRTRSQGL